MSSAEELKPKSPCILEAQNNSVNWAVPLESPAVVEWKLPHQYKTKKTLLEPDN